MRLTELLSRAGLRQSVAHDPVITGLSADSRTVQTGYLFAALPGLHHDGGVFVPAAAVAGAVAILATPDTAVPNGIAHIKSDNPRLAIAQLAAAYYAPLPQTLVAVTGTNGKTSTVNFVQQLWQAAGLKGAALGTLGIRGPGVDRDGSLTTPDPVSLAADLSMLAHHGITHAALEASSHGLHQYRLDGLHLKAAGFTYIGRDHLDYHGTIENYFAAKTELFTRVLPPDGTAVLNADIPEFAHLKKLCTQRGQTVLSYGAGSIGDADLRLLTATPQPTGLDVSLDLCGVRIETGLAVTGTFQAGNILCALGLAISAGLPVKEAAAALPHIANVRGRMERVSDAHSDVGIYVDYAHTPDALETVLKALRPHTKGRLLVVFGCGGNRDKGKRPVMGQIAATLADLVIVTDDNPRLEDPATIRAEVLQGAAGAQEVADRAKAIQTAMNQLKPGDTLLIAGKGHEQGQIVGHETRPFDDADIVRAAQRGMKAV